MAKTTGHALDLDEAAWLCQDRAVGIRIPIPVSERLDRMVAAATGAGERTSRQELVAALIANADLGGEAVADNLRHYRKMKVRDCLPGQASDGSNVVHIADHKPGPRVLPTA